MTDTTLAVLIPVLNRPRNVAPLVESLHTSLRVELAEGWEYAAYFICSRDDRAEIDAVRAVGLEPMILDEPSIAEGQYARKINHAANLTSETWILTAADDLRFHPGWLRACINEHVKTGALVIGTNDMHNPAVMRGFYATHLLVHRSYLELGTIDEPGKIFHEGYSHNCPDSEAVETARFRGTFTSARYAKVEHLHPIYRNAPDDDVYRKGKKHHAADRKILQERRRMWIRPRLPNSVQASARPTPVSRWPRR